MIKKIKIFKIKSFKSYTGSLTPITFKKNFPFFVKRIFFLYGKKIKLEEIMHIKNVRNFLYQSTGMQSLPLKLTKR